MVAGSMPARRSATSEVAPQSSSQRRPSLSRSMQVCKPAAAAERVARAEEGEGQSHQGSAIVGPPAAVNGRKIVATRAMFSAIVSALHLLALAIGLPAVYLRGRALKGRLDRDGFQRLFAADSVWGAAAALWLVTGLLRAFGGLEKGSAFYLGSRLFWLKMGLFLLVVALEIWPMVTLIRWRVCAAPRRHPRHLGRARALRHHPRRDGAGGADGVRRRVHGSRLRRALTRGARPSQRSATAPPGRSEQCGGCGGHVGAPHVTRSRRAPRSRSCSRDVTARRPAPWWRPARVGRRTHRARRGSPSGSARRSRRS